MIDQAEIRKKALTELFEEGYTISNPQILPYPDNSNLRDTKSIYTRAVVCAFFKSLSVYAKDPLLEAREWAIETELIKYFSSDENRIIGEMKLSRIDEINLSWYSECLYMTLYVLGICRLLLPVDKEAKMEPFARRIPPNVGLDEFTKTIDILPSERIFVIRDKYYLLHWHLKKKKVKDRTNSIIRERRRAIEWICDDSLDWDDISLDT